MLGVKINCHVLELWYVYVFFVFLVFLSFISYIELVLITDTKLLVLK